MRSRRVGPLPTALGAEMFRQGALRALAVEGGYFVVLAGRAAAWVDASSWGVDAFVVDESPPSLYVLEHAVLLLVRALEQRVKGHFHIHAGLVVDRGGLGTLIAGEGGAGKTTTTLALLSAGARLAGDDVAFLERDPDRAAVVHARALPRPLHVGEVTLRMFPAVAARLRADALSLQGKRIVDVDADVTGRVAVSRIVFPSIGSVPTHARRLSPAEAMPRLLVAGAMVVWPHLPHAEEHLRALEKLALGSTWAVQLGPDAIEEPARIVRVLEDLWPGDGVGVSSVMQMEARGGAA